MKKKILVTGSNGQLGLSIKHRVNNYPRLDFIFTDIKELDITNPSELDIFFAENSFYAIINCAAYTAVDKAEDDASTAYLINSTAVKYLAKISYKFNIPLVQISTDYVFDGNSQTPYTEETEPNPTSVYGKTKYEAEKLIMGICKRAMIIRTSWLYSEYGHNFVKTILRLSNEKEELRIVSDQIGSPTYAGDLSDAILEIIENNELPATPSIFHYSNEDQTSWYEFAKAIVEQSNSKCLILPVKTSEYKSTKAPRPFYSLLSKKKYKNHFNRQIPNWKYSLAKCITNINNSG